MNELWTRQDFGHHRLYCGDCLHALQDVAAQSIDLILTDLPYGTTQNKWDCPIDLDHLWQHFLRIVKPVSAIVLTASQPFTARLVMSQLGLFRHEWIWLKNRGSNFANTVREPMKEHESVLVFAPGKWTYNKQMQPRTGSGGDRVAYGFNFRSKTENYSEFAGREGVLLPELRVPSSWQKFNTQVGLHPTQKPVDLMRYLVRTYSNQGDTVLDATMGSGTTGIAALCERRHFIGIERDSNHFQTAAERFADEQHRTDWLA